jgi:hypothetical protein
MINMNWTVDANGQISATWNESDTAERMPKSLAMMEETPVPPVRSAAGNYGAFTRLALILSAVLHMGMTPK